MLQNTPMQKRGEICAEQRLWFEEFYAEWPICHKAGGKQAGLGKTLAAAGCKPHRMKPATSPAMAPRALALFQMKTAHQSRQELCHGSKGNQPDLRQRAVVYRQPIEGIGQREQRQNGDPAHIEQEPPHVRRVDGIISMATQDQRDHQIIGKS